MATSTIIQQDTTLIVVELSNANKSVVLPSNPIITTSFAETEGRILYIKATPGNPPPTIETASLFCSTAVTIAPGLINRNISTHFCVTLQEFPTNIYNLLNYYTHSVSTFVSPSPTSVAVNVPGDKSFVFVDLQTQSKTLVLPRIESLTTTNSKAPYFMIKDSYGKATTNNLFISTSGADTIEGLGNSIQLTINSCVIELMGDRNLNRWHVLNYFEGGL